MRLIELASTAEEAVSHNPRIRKKVMIRWHEMEPLTNFSQAVFPPGEVANAHAHSDMTEVFFIESGCGEMAVDGHVYPVGAGSCLVVEPGESHELRNTGSGDLVVTYFGLRHG